MRSVFVLLILATFARANAPAVDLSVQLDTAKHAIDAVAGVALLPGGGDKLTFALNAALEVDPKSTEGLAVRKVGASKREGWTEWEVVSEGHEACPIAHVHYHGELYDPPKAEGGLRHVAGGHTSGTIGPEGVYLHGGTGWYPVLSGQMVLYSIEATVQKGWHLVGQGKRAWEKETDKGTAVRWENTVPASALDVVAGPYVVTDAKWNDVQISTYLFEGEKDFSKVYIDAATKYLDFYSKLLGPYAYPQLSIVENFFSTGYGMPSYTLLGREVVQMAERYTGAVGLGHEIVHNWWGNGVFVDESEGNWCEGLTTYCANYYWVEAHDGPEEAKKTRRHILERFSIQVKPEEDYPLKDFKTKTTEMDDEIGYDKACFLFHTIRRRIGDDAFWKGLRSMSADFVGRAAKWSDFVEAFGADDQRVLGSWVQAWIQTKGIPTLTGRLREDAGGIRADVSMEGHLPCDVPIRSEGEETVELQIPMETAHEAPVVCPAKGCRRVLIDPEFHVFRRLMPQELVPCLNRVLSATKHVIVKPTGGSEEERAAYDKVAARLQENGKWDIITDADPAPAAGASVLYLGGIGVNKAVEKLSLPQGVTLAKDGYEVAGKKGAAPAGALLLSFARPDDPTQVATVFFGLSAEAATKAQRYLFYYGWQSWYTFGPEGKAADRGDFPLGPSPLVLESPK